MPSSGDMFQINDVVVLRCPVACDDDADIEPGVIGMISHVYPGGLVFEVRFRGSRESHTVSVSELTRR